MFSKTRQPTLKIFPSNYLLYNVKSNNMCGIVKRPCSSKVIAFSNQYLLSFSWERGFLMGSGVTE